LHVPVTSDGPELPTGSAAPRPAATLVLLRDSDAGPEVLLTRRPEGMRFMGGATVFPGGAIDPADLDERWERASTLSRADAAAALAPVDVELALGAFICAIRETFEEVGWLAAERPTGTLRPADAEDPARFLACCLADGTVVATDRLVPAGRWVTPQGSPIRFDTFFFVTAAGDGWEPERDPGEVDAAWWATPGNALKEHASGASLMAPPTIEMLQRLAGHGSVAELLESLRAPSSGPTIAATRLSPLVQLVVAPNAGVMTGPGTNTYIVGSAPSTVIDPAVDERAYVDAVAAAAGDVTSILVTHRHSDHVGGAAALAARTGAEVRAWGRAPAGDAPVEPLSDGEVLDAGGARIHVLHTPGHASDHLCFWLEGGASLFSGDSVLGEGTAVIAPPDGDMGAYLASLRRLLGWRLSRIYPGHWPPLDGGTAVIERYIAHRLEREAAIVEALASGPATVEDIVARVYVDTPSHLHPVAAHSVRAHLQLLEATGRVKEANERWAPGGVD
jgi:glyoxylase-like metal-dependent hydrolase (beta-lactamase superfamily II)/8-oxo-dGTP pyrophosphatase MutT (NUDIX family)